MYIFYTLDKVGKSTVCRLTHPESIYVYLCIRPVDWLPGQTGCTAPSLGLRPISEQGHSFKQVKQSQIESLWAMSQSVMFWVMSIIKTRETFTVTHNCTSKYSYAEQCFNIIWLQCTIFWNLICMFVSQYNYVIKRIIIDLLAVEHQHSHYYRTHIIKVWMLVITCTDLTNEEMFLRS